MCYALTVVEGAYCRVILKTLPTLKKAVAVQLYDHLPYDDLHVLFSPHFGVVTAHSQL